MALPKTGTLGQTYNDNGYTYQWTGVGWHIIGQTLLIVSNTNILANGTLTISNSTANSIVLSNKISVSNNISNTSVSPDGIFSGNSTTNVRITASSFSVGNTTINSNGVLSFSPSPIPVPGVATAVNTNLTSNGLVVANNNGNTIIGAGRITVSTNTVIGGDSIFIGNNSSNVFVNSSAIYFTNGINQSTGVPFQSFMNASFFSGTSNNALYVGGVSSTNIVTTSGNFNIAGNLNFIASNTFFTSNANFTGSKIYYDTQLAGSYYTGTSYNALNAEALGNFTVDVFELKQDLAADVLLLKSACSAFSDDSAKLGGVVAAAYVNTSGNYTISGIQTHTNNVEIRGAKLVINNSSNIWANGRVGFNGEIFVSNGTTVYWAPPGQLIDVTVPYIWQNTHRFRGNDSISNTVFGNTTVFANIASNTSGVFFTGTSFNSQKLGGTLASSYALMTYVDTMAATAYTNSMSSSLSRDAVYTGHNRFSTDITIGDRYQFGQGYISNFANSSFFTITNHSTYSSGYSIHTATVNNFSITLSNSVASYPPIGTYYANDYVTVVNTSTIYISNTSVMTPTNAFGTSELKTFSANTSSITIANNIGYSAKITPNQLYIGNLSISTNVVGDSIKFKNQIPTTSGAISFVIPTGQVGSRNTLLVDVATHATISTIETALNGGLTPYFYKNGVYTGTIIAYGSFGGIATITLDAAYTFNLNDVVLLNAVYNPINGSINTTAYTGESNSAIYFGGALATSYVNTTGSYSLAGDITLLNAAKLSINRLVANGSSGLGGQVLTSSGSAANVFWVTIGAEGGIGSVTRVSTGVGLTGGPIVGFGTISVVPGTGIVANSTGVFTNDVYLSTLFGSLGGATYTGPVTFSKPTTFSNDVIISGNLTLTGNTVIIGANNLVVNDAIISLHSPSTLAPLIGNDTRLIGTAYHYYDTEDRHAMLVMNQSNSWLTYYNTAQDPIGSSPQGIGLGTIQANSFYAGNSSVGGTIRIGNTTVFATINSTSYTGSVAGISSTNYVTSTYSYNATMSGQFTFNSTTGGVKLNTQVYANNALPAGAGKVLASGGSSTGANVYWADITSLVPSGGTVTSISVGDGLNGGTITLSGSISAKASNGILVDTNGISAYGGSAAGSGSAYSIISNTSGLYVDTTWLALQTVYNSNYLTGVDGNKFVQNTSSRTLSGNLTFGTGAVTSPPGLGGTNTVFNTNVSFNNYISTNTIPQTNNAQLLGNSTHRWISLYVTGKGTTGSGIYIGNTYLTDDVTGTSDALVVNTFISNTATVNNFFGNNALLDHALPANSGGTGIKVYTVGDIFYASATNALSLVSLPTGVGVSANGQILQIINNKPAWGVIDGGETNWAPL